MQVHLTTLGCRLNEAELEHWANGFQQKGFEIVPASTRADMVVINTCAVTREAARKSRQLIRRTHRHNPRAKIVVSGCYSSLSPGVSNEIAGIDLVIPNQDKDRLVEITTEKLALENMPALASVPGESPLFRRGRNRAFVKIQDGCRNQCTFCIVTVARGEERSRPVHAIIDEINQLYTQGINEVVLTGVHVGGYGSDINSNLFTLLQHVLQDTDMPRIRLGSVEPWDLPEHFFSLFEDQHMMPHLHLPLQSGSDRILKRMARRCSTKNFKRLVSAARETHPDFNLTTDIIVGFPGETGTDWQTGLDFIREIGFSHIHIFAYSPRHGTRAATLTDQITPTVKKSRSKELHALARQLKQTYYKRFLGREVPVLWEGGYETEMDDFYGYTHNFMRVKSSQPEGHLQNQVLPASLQRYDPGEEVISAVVNS